MEGYEGWKGTEREREREFIRILSFTLIKANRVLQFSGRTICEQEIKDGAQQIRTEIRKDVRSEREKGCLKRCKEICIKSGIGTILCGLEEEEKSQRKKGLSPKRQPFIFLLSITTYVPTYFSDGTRQTHILRLSYTCVYVGRQLGRQLVLLTDKRKIGRYRYL